MRWHATVDGADLTEAELLQLAEAKRPVVRLRGRWVRADPARLRRLAERTPVAAGDLLAAGLWHLAEHGATDAILYVDDDEPGGDRDRAAANRLYDRIGFSEVDRLHSYTRP